ncbi:hypothetical protein PR048_023911 [Dryococelus australis]|uniref:Uncharacterized protein n=1 Tax=Dryococelus australis TaxID=614101 RepID=A0ABQ9GVG5_9NEOP|nr:hypothetical protein PR048_023911 [Dryococelus australis]
MVSEGHQRSGLTTAEDTRRRQSSRVSAMWMDESARYSMSWRLLRTRVSGDLQNVPNWCNLYEGLIRLAVSATRQCVPEAREEVAPVPTVCKHPPPPPPIHRHKVSDLLLEIGQFASSFHDKIDVKHTCTEVDFAIGSPFIRHTLDDSEPIADFQGNKKGVPYCQVRSNTGYSMGQQPMNKHLRLEGFTVNGSDGRETANQTLLSRLQPLPAVTGRRRFQLRDLRTRVTQHALPGESPRWPRGAGEALLRVSGGSATWGEMPSVIKVAFSAEWNHFAARTPASRATDVVAQWQFGFLKTETRHIPKRNIKGDMTLLKLSFEKAFLPNALCAVRSNKRERHMRNAGCPWSVRTDRLEEVIRQHINNMTSTSTRSVARQMDASLSTVWDVLEVNRRHPYRWKKVHGIQLKYVFKTPFSQAHFPARLAFAMTIDKAQGESLQVCGLNLENPFSSHGHLYVAWSRVEEPSDLFVRCRSRIFTVGIVPDDATGLRVFSGISRFPRPCIPHFTLTGIPCLDDSVEAKLPGHHDRFIVQEKSYRDRHEP